MAVEHAQAHPRFKYFSEAGEEPFQSFLGVPLIDNGVLQGALVVQTLEPRHFSDDEIEALMAAAAQVAPIISEARARAPLHRAGAGKAVGAGAQPVVELGPGLRQPVPGPRAGALAAS